MATTEEILVYTSFGEGFSNVHNIAVVCFSGVSVKSSSILLSPFDIFLTLNFCVYVFVLQGLL